MPTTKRKNSVEFDIDKIAEEVAGKSPGNAMEGFEDAIAASDEWAKSHRKQTLDFARRRLKESWFPNVKATAIGIGADWGSMVLRAAGDAESADLATMMGDAYQQAAEERSPGTIKRALRGVGRTLPTAIATSPSGPGGMIGTFAVQEWNRALAEGREAGMKNGELLGYAATQGAIEGGIAGLFQLAGMGGVEKTLSGGMRKAASRGLKEGLKAAGRTAIQELPEEVLTELSHNVASKVSGVDPKAMSWETTRGTIQDTVLQTLLTVGVAETPNVVSSYRSGDMKRIAGEIMEAAEAGVKVSRKQWTKWGFSSATGKSFKERIARVREIADGIIGRKQTAQQQEAAQPADASTELGPVTHDVEAASVPRVSAGQDAEVSTATQAVASEAAPDVVEASAAARRAPSQHDFPVEMQGTGEEMGGREVVRQLQQIWGTPLNLGHMSAHKNARGIYKTKRHVARLASGEEASPAVEIHEAIGHHLDFTTDVLKSAPKDAKAEVAELDYDQSQKRPYEGFAEFIRAYLTGATEIHKGGINLEKATPKFLAHFKAWIAAHPDIQAKLIESREPIAVFIRSGAVGRVKGQISTTGKDESSVKPSLIQRIKGWAQFLYTRLKDEGTPVRLFTEEAKEKGYQPGQESTPYEVYNALRNAGSHFAQQAIEGGVFTITGTPTKIGPSLREAMEEIEPGEDSRNFAAWAYARHAIESWGKVKNPGITLDDARDTMRQLNDPRYERAADKLTQFNNALIDVLADSGVLSQDEAKQIKDAYQHYIPLERAKQGTHPAGGRRMLDLSPAVRGRKGSGLQIIDPIEATLSRAVRFYERAAKQLVLNRMIQVSDGVKGLGGWVDDVSTRIRGTSTNIGEVKEKTLAEFENQVGSGTDLDILSDLLDILDPDTALTIWRPDMTKIHGEPIYRVVLKGEPRFYQMDPELGKALGGLDTVQHLDPVTHIMRNLTGFLKLGATKANPDFIVTNAMRDFSTFILQGEKGLTGAFDPARFATAYVVHELGRMAGKDGVKEVALFKMMGGELSTFAGLDRARLMKGRARVIRGRQGKIETAMNVLGVTEVASRIAEFSAVLEKEGWLDKVRAGQMPPMEVLIRAINAAHDVTIDFRRMGQWGRYLNYYIPFFNARLEGLDKFVRTLSTDWKKASLRAGMAVVLPSLIYWWLRHDDDDYKERPAWQDNFYILKDGDGNPVWRIPKPQEWGLIGSGVERMLDAMYDRDPEAINRWFGQVFKNVNPGGLPAGVTPLFESMFNYDSFRGREIESKTLQKLEPHKRYYEHSTKVSKGVAKTLHDISGGRVRLSPARIDHLANGLTGGLYGRIDSYSRFGTNLFSGGELSMSDVPGIGGVTLRADYARSVDDFYQMKELLDQNIQTSKSEDRKVSQEILDAYDRVGFAESLMSDMRKAAKDLPAEERVETQLAIIGLARAALGRSSLERYPNPLAEPSVVPAKVRGVVVDHIAKKQVTASGMSKGSGPAWRYLKQMGVDAGAAQALAYRRLRRQGVSEKAAARRSRSGF